MKNLKLLAALLALTIGLAGCGGSSKGGNSSASSASKNMLDGNGMIASGAQKQEYEEPEDVTYMRFLAGEAEYSACVLYLGGSYEVTTDVQKVLDSQADLRQLWSFVYDIPEDHYVVSPDGGCDLYCIFPQDPQATLFVYEVSLTDDAENPLKRGKQLYYSEDGQPILLLCNISDIAPNTEVELYPGSGEELVFSPFLSGENGHVVQTDGVCDFTIYPEGDDWETDTSPWSLEGNWPFPIVKDITEYSLYPRFQYSGMKICTHYDIGIGDSIMNKMLSCRYNMDTNRVETKFVDGIVLSIDCIAIEDEYGNTPSQRAELDWLLYNKPLEYAQMVLSGEIEHYLSLGCDHGRLED